MLKTTSSHQPLVNFALLIRAYSKSLTPFFPNSPSVSLVFFCENVITRPTLSLQEVFMSWQCQNTFSCFALKWHRAVLHHPVSSKFYHGEIFAFGFSRLTFYSVLRTFSNAKYWWQIHSLFTLLKKRCLCSQFMCCFF